VRWPSGRRRRFAKRKLASRPTSIFLVNPSFFRTSPIDRIGCRWLAMPRFWGSQGQSWGQFRQLRSRSSSPFAKLRQRRFVVANSSVSVSPHGERLTVLKILELQQVWFQACADHLAGMRVYSAMQHDDSRPNRLECLGYTPISCSRIMSSGFPGGRARHTLRNRGRWNRCRTSTTAAST